MKQALDGFLKYFSPAEREVSLLSPQARPTPPLSWMPSPVTGRRRKESPIDRAVNTRARCSYTHLFEGVNANECESVAKIRLRKPAYHYDKLSLNLLHLQLTSSGVSFLLQCLIIATALCTLLNGHLILHIKTFCI